MRKAKTLGEKLFEAFYEARVNNGGTLSREEWIRIADDTLAPVVAKKRRSIGLGAGRTDSEWLEELAADPILAGIDVAKEFEKCRRWCSLNRQTISRRRFVNWLCKADRTMSAEAAKKRDVLDLGQPPAGWEVTAEKIFGPGPAAAMIEQGWQLLDDYYRRKIASAAQLTHGR